MRTIAGIDPGFRNTGISIFYLDEDGTMTFVSSKCVSTKRVKGKGYVSFKDAEAIRGAMKTIIDYLKAAKVEFVVIELPTGGARSSSACRSLGIATAMSVWIHEVCGCEYHYVTPSSVKKAATGDPFAEKKAIIDTIGKLFPQILDHPVTKQEHVADSVACILAWKKEKQNDRNN